jgi:hypothetical protein
MDALCDTTDDIVAMDAAPEIMRFVTQANTLLQLLGQHIIMARRHNEVLTPVVHIAEQLFTRDLTNKLFHFVFSPWNRDANLSQLFFVSDDECVFLESLSPASKAPELGTATSTGTCELCSFAQNSEAAWGKSTLKRKRFATP